MTTDSLLLGLFVGGTASRMGGIAKGLLAAPGGGSVVERLYRVTQAAAPHGTAVWVGTATAYCGALPLEAVADDPPRIGPLGGLHALLLEAKTRGADQVVALAGDMPYVTQALVTRLLTEAPEAAALAPRMGKSFHPLFARYRTDAALPACRTVLERGERALFSVLRELGAGVAELRLDAEEERALRDWDTAEDVENG